jgi:hypothetical protein
LDDEARKDTEVGMPAGVIHADPRNISSLYMNALAAVVERAADITDLDYESHGWLLDVIGTH